MLTDLLTLPGLSVDIETISTTGKQKDALHFKRSSIDLIGFSYFIGQDIKSECYTLQEVIDSGIGTQIFNRKLVGHNLKFDLKSLQKYFNVDANNIYFDTAIAGKLLDENSDNDLGSLALREIKQGKIGSFNEEDIEKRKAYCANDARLALMLVSPLSQKIREQGLQQLFSLEMEVERVFYKAELAGVPIDISYLTILLEQYTKHTEKITGRVYKLAGIEFNINSTQQLGDLLYNKFCFEIIQKTDKGKPSTDTRTLSKLAEGLNPCKLPGMILRYRHWEMLCRHIEKLLKESIDGVVYGTFNTLGAETGRFSCSEPNLQQIPSKSKESKAIRKGFNGGLVVCDYSNIELRLLAHFTRDPKLLKAYLPGGSQDLHSETAKMLGISRGQAKTVNFGICYGMGSGKLADSLKISKDEAQLILDEWYKAYSFVNPWKLMIVNSIKKYGFVRSIYGRKRRIRYNSLSYKETFKAEREAVNFVIQGSSADITKLAIARLNQYDIRLQVHDELVIKATEKDLEDIKNTMESIGEQLNIKVPLIVDAHYADNWMEAK